MDTTDAQLDVNLYRSIIRALIFDYYNVVSCEHPAQEEEVLKMKLDWTLDLWWLQSQASWKNSSS